MAYRTYDVHVELSIELGVVPGDGDQLRGHGLVGRVLVCTQGDGGHPSLHPCQGVAS